MNMRHQRYTRTETLLPYTTLFRSGTAYRSDSFSITPTTGIRARKPAPEIGMHRDQRLPFERTFRERYIEAIGIARLLDADPAADEKNAPDALRPGDETGNKGHLSRPAKPPPASGGERARVDKPATRSPKIAFSKV